MLFMSDIWGSTLGITGVPWPLIRHLWPILCEMELPFKDLAVNGLIGSFWHLWYSPCSILLVPHSCHFLGSGPIELKWFSCPPPATWREAHIPVCGVCCLRTYITYIWHETRNRRLIMTIIRQICPVIAKSVFDSGITECSQKLTSPEHRYPADRSPATRAKDLQSSDPTAAPSHTNCKYQAHIIPLHVMLGTVMCFYTECRRVRFLYMCLYR